MPDFGICHLPVVPIRAEAFDKSEQISQLLFGEAVTIIEVTPKWTHVRCNFDGYEGWIDSKQYQSINESVAEQLTTVHQYVALDVLNKAQNTAKQPIQLPIGSTLPAFDGTAFGWENNPYYFFGKTVVAGSVALTDKLESIALSFLNAPYQWGGRSPLGIDCSGFTQVVFKILGKKLKRDAWQQAEQGVLVNFIEEVKEGDLVFFDNEEGKIIHVGIALNHHKIIHASGCVRIDKLDHNGIFNTETKKYSHNLRIIKRVL